jgi:AcrR family transcriptional regulator
MIHSTFDLRKEEVLEAAITVFATDGYNKVTTADISKVAGISQPYIYRFFTSKEELFLAVVDRIYNRIIEAFRTIPPGPDFEVRLIRQYEKLMVTHPREIMLQVQTWGIRDERIREKVARSLLDLLTTVQEAFAFDDPASARTKAEDFLARGVLCNLAMILGAPELYRSRTG